MSGYHLALALGFSAGGLVVRVSGFGVRDRAWGLQGGRAGIFYSPCAMGFTGVGWSVVVSVPRVCRRASWGSVY